MKEIQKLIEIEKMKAKVEVLQEISFTHVNDEANRIIQHKIKMLMRDIEKKRKMVNV